jgi:putative serine protease PepD
VGVALVAALFGGIIGGAVGWATRGTATPTGSVTIMQGSSTPGAAILASGTSIPSLVKAVSPAVVSIDVKSAFEGEDEGTGMIISPNGLVVTNNHVIASAVGGDATITVTRTGTTQVLSATLLGTNATDDVALLRIDGASHLPAVTFGNSSRLEVGDGVVAIGNALGLAAGTPTVTQGIVSALGRTVTAGSESSTSTETLYGMIQTDAAINPGNSGGPLIDSSGQVIGMNTAVAGATSNGENAQNIGFAIPASRIETLIPTLLRGSTTPTRKGGFMGVFIESVTKPLATQLDLSVSSGSYVEGVQPGLPAQNAGIEVGDVIVEINSTTITSNADVSSVMRTVKPGQTIQVGIVRGTQHLTIPVTVIAPPSS